MKAHQLFARVQHAEVTASNHFACIAQQCLDGMADRGCLPFVTGERTHAKEHERDVLLGCAIANGIEGAQHASRPYALLFGHAPVSWNAPAMDGGKQAINGLKSGEAIAIERNDSRQWRAIGREQLYVIARGQMQDGVRALLVALNGAEVNEMRLRRWGKDFGRWCKDDDAGIVFRQPEHRRI